MHHGSDRIDHQIRHEIACNRDWVCREDGVAEVVRREGRAEAGLAIYDDLHFGLPIVG